MSDEKQCFHCVHYAVRYTIPHNLPAPLCTLDRPLVPCEFYEREPGADDDLGEQA